jgi:hypothetical protein
VTIAWAVARIGAVAYILGYIFAHLPPASIYDTGALTIPDVIWDPLVAVLSLGRLLPIQTLLILVGFTLAIQGGLVLFWIGSWVLRHLLGGG